MKKMKMILAAAALIYISQGGVARAECEWDPTGWFDSNPDICAQAENEAGPEDTSETRINIDPKLEAGYVCPGWYGNTTVKAACEDTGIFGTCRTNVTAIFDGYLHAKCGTLSDGTFSCKKSSANKFFAFKKTLATNPSVTAANQCRNDIVNQPHGIAICGNGVKDAGEQCDGADKPAGFFCSMSCKIYQPFPPAGAVCGNGKLETGEKCDGALFENSNVPAGTVCDASCGFYTLPNLEPTPQPAPEATPPVVAEGNADATVGQTALPKIQAGAVPAAGGSGCSLGIASPIQDAGLWSALFFSAAFIGRRKRKS